MQETAGNLLCLFSANVTNITKYLFGRQTVQVIKHELFFYLFSYSIKIPRFVLCLDPQMHNE